MRKLKLDPKKVKKEVIENENITIGEKQVERLKKEGEERSDLELEGTERKSRKRRGEGYLCVSAVSLELCLPVTWFSMEWGFPKLCRFRKVYS